MVTRFDFMSIDCVHIPESQTQILISECYSNLLLQYSQLFVDIALEKSERELGLKFETVTRLYPDFCNATLSTGFLSDLVHNHHIDAVIGPGCSGENFSLSICRSNFADN